MPSLPGMNGDVYFGDTERPLPDWREGLPEDESDDDALSEEESAAVIGMLGFDPDDPELEGLASIPPRPATADKDTKGP